MFARIAIPVFASASLLAGTAMAASQSKHDDREAGRRPQFAAMTSLVEKCTSLEQQTITAIRDHASAKKIVEAKKMQEEGSKLCASDKKEDGVKKLQQALRDLGVKPQY
ncbi:MAG TPA: hypothetical protein VIK47_05790 [Kiloniellales bacterium]